MTADAKMVLLTGASGKFGRIFIAHLLQRGHRVVATARSTEALELLRLTLSDQGVPLDGFHGLVADFSRDAAVADLLGEVEPMGVQVLINNARSLDHLKTEANGVVNRNHFVQEYVIDVVVPYELSMGLVLHRHSVLQQVINIGSQYGSVAANLRLYDSPMVDSPIQYSVAKAALTHLTKEMGVRLASRDIQVNCIAYGGVEGRATDSFKTRFAQLSPIGRMLSEQEIIAPLEMLIAHPGMSMTGHTIQADGGWSLW